MSFLKIYNDMKSPLFKTTAFGKLVTAEIHAQEATQNETRTEGQRTRPQVAPRQRHQAHERCGAVLRAKRGKTGGTSLCHTDRPETSI